MDFTETQKIEIFEKKLDDTGFKCNQCGKCCLVLDGIILEKEDVVRWKKEGREDLLKPSMLLAMHDFANIPNEILGHLKKEGGELFNRALELENKAAKENNISFKESEEYKQIDDEFSKKMGLPKNRLKDILDVFRKQCPHLGVEDNKFICKIHDTKPLFCRTFPHETKHALSFANCEPVKEIKEFDIEMGLTHEDIPFSFFED